VASKKGNDLILVKLSDWQGLYINNTLWGEQHRLILEDVLSELAKLGTSITSFRLFNVEDEKNFEEKLGYFFPKSFTDLQNTVKLIT